MVKINIENFAKEVLFLDDPGSYPDHVWSDFFEALDIILSTEDIRILECRYGDESSELSKSDFRNALSRVVFQIKQSSIYEEILLTLGNLDAEYFVRGQECSENPLSAQYLDLLGLESRPFKIGGITFDTLVENSPVYLWKSADLPVPFWFLKKITEACADENYQRMILVADPRLVGYIPAEKLRISVNVLPLTSIPKDSDIHDNLIHNESNYVS